MEKDSGQIFHDLKKDLSAYVELKLELLKLNTYERTGKIISILSYGLILLFLIFFIFLFISLALGFFIGDWLDSKVAGFGVVAIVYLIMVGIAVKSKKKISDKVLNKVIAAMTANDDKNTEKNNGQSTNSSTETNF